MKTRTVFSTSRLLEFCTVAELTKLVGFDPGYWPAVVVKEATDNGLDACEEAGIAPEIDIAISPKKGTITVSDNGPGIVPETVVRLLDYRNKTSSREAYVAPTRGAQGNALQALLAMAFTLDGKTGASVIEACGVVHHIVFGIDLVRREPKIEHEQRRSIVQNGTRLTLIGTRIVQIIGTFAWLNPHGAKPRNSETNSRTVRSRPWSWS
jgi:DNA topoisomerase VI subunit B